MHVFIRRLPDSAFHFKRICFYKISSDSNGGAIYSQVAVSAVIDTCSFEKCSAQAYGAFSCCLCTSFMLSKSLVDQCEASSEYHSFNIQIDGIGNVAHGTFIGIKSNVQRNMVITASEITISHCNSTLSRLGSNAWFAQMFSMSTVNDVEYCYFTDNTGYTEMIRFDNVVDFHHNNVLRNTVEMNLLILYPIPPGATVTNSVFIKNVRPSIWSNPTMQLSNCTFDATYVFNNVVPTNTVIRNDATPLSGLEPIVAPTFYDPTGIFSFDDFHAFRSYSIVCVGWLIMIPICPLYAFL